MTSRPGDWLCGVLSSDWCCYDLLGYIQEDADEEEECCSGLVLAKRVEMDDNFQFGDTGEAKKVSIIIKYGATQY